jgi:hypothetical protein
MKILWITKVYSPRYTGGTKVSYHYIEELKKNDEVTIHSLIEYFDTKKAASLYTFYKTLLLLKRTKYDAVFFDDHFGFLSIFFEKTKTVLFYHGNWPRLLFLNFIYFLKGMYLFPLYLMGMRFSGLTIFVNDYYENKFKNVCNESTTLLNPVKVAIQSLNKDSSESGHIHVVLVGNIDDRKYSRFIDFMEWVKFNKINNRLQFDIYGKFIDDHIVKKINYPNVRLLGFQDTISYSRYNFHISFSKVENMPLSLFEALVSNVPCIYPDEVNYSTYKSVNGIFLYNSFAEVLDFLCVENVQVNNSFIPRTYTENINILKERIRHHGV